MQTRSSLKEALERRGAIPAESPGQSTFPRVRLLVIAGRIERPVDLIRLFKGHGLSLKAAHATVDRLVAGNQVATELQTDDIDALIGDLAALGVTARRRAYQYPQGETTAGEE